MTSPVLFALALLGILAAFAAYPAASVGAQKAVETAFMMRNIQD